LHGLVLCSIRASVQTRETRSLGDTMLGSGRPSYRSALD